MFASRKADSAEISILDDLLINDEVEKQKLQERKQRKQRMQKNGGRILLIFYFSCNIVLHAIGYFYFIIPHLEDWSVVPYFYIFSVLSVACYAITSFSDPGYLPRNTLKESDKNQPGIKICDTCQLVRPLRAKHCSLCGRCIAKFDHHCPFMNNCVGSKNDPYFIGFLVFQNIVLSIALYYGIQIYRDLDPDLLLFGRSKTTICFQTLCVVAGFWLLSLALAVMGLFRVRFNITSNECINAEKYSYVSLTGSYRNRNDRGTLENCFRFFTCDDTPVPVPNPAEQLKENKLKTDFFDMILQPDRRPKNETKNIQNV